MKLNLVACATCALMALSNSAALAAAELSLTRMECGTPQAPTLVNQRFSDTYALGDTKVQFVYSCYLVKHGDSYLLWDTGFATGAPNTAPKLSLVDQLAQLGVKPEQIGMVAISHYHGDHIGQAGSFPGATLMIGKGDWDVVSNAKPADSANYKSFEPWLKGEGKVEPLGLDKDVFGDGSVIILMTPGHTPGHCSLLVKLAQKGPVIITGDAAHFHENYASDGVPTFNTDRAQTIASIDRLKKLVTNLKATLIIQHDARDVDKLPAFPESAK